MNASSSLRVTVNGTKYHITGIQKETSCKDLLCALAKATRNCPRLLPSIAETGPHNIDRTRPELSAKAIYGVKHNSAILRTSPRYDENILGKLKSVCLRTGDAESLKILNSLGSKVKIYAHDSAHTPDIGVDEAALSYKRRKKKRRSEKETHDRKDSKNKAKHSHQKASKKGIDFLSREVETVKTTAKKGRSNSRRSVDDSDLESYKQESLTRSKKQPGRVYDDSDLDLYQSLLHLVIEQTKQLNNLRSQQRDVRKVAFVKELKRTSQIYFIDDQSTSTSAESPPNTDNRPTVADNDEEANDSGLPSADYDSSSSQETVAKDLYANTLLPIRKYSRTAKHADRSSLAVQLSASCSEQIVSPSSITLTDNSVDKLSKPALASTSTISLTELNRSEISATRIDLNCITSSHSRTELRSSYSTGQKKLLDNLGRTVVGGKRLSICSVSSTTSTLRNEVIKNINDVEIVVDTTSVVWPENERNMVVDAVFMNKNGKKTVSSDSKKVEKKKKIKKADISEPILIDPANFKKHSKLRDVEPAVESSPLARETSGKLKWDKKFRVSSRRKKKDEVVEFTPVDRLPPPPPLPVTAPPTSLTSPVSTNESAPSSEITENENKLNAVSTESRTEPDNIPVDCTDESLPARTSSKRHSSKHRKHKHGEHRSPSKERLKGTKNASETMEKSTSSAPEHSPDIVSSNDSADHNSRLKVLENTANTKDIQGQPSEAQVITDTTSQCKNLESDIRPNPDNATSNIQTSTSSSVSEQTLTPSTTEPAKLAALSCDEKLTSDHFHVTVPTDAISLENDSGIVSPSSSQASQSSPSHTSKTSDHVPNLESSSETNSSSQRLNQQDLPTSLKSSSTGTCEPSAQDTHVDPEKQKLVDEYLSVVDSLKKLSWKITETNLTIANLAEELQSLDQVEKDATEDQTLVDDEEKVGRELADVKSLLKSVTELTSYQRREVSQNMITMDSLDQEIRKQRAAYENIASGAWQNSAKSAPRSLLKRKQELKLPGKMDHISLV